MFRQKTGSVVCASCGSLVGVNDDRCYTCGRTQPGTLGVRPGVAPLRQRPRIRLAGGLRLRRSLYRHAGVDRRSRRQHFAGSRVLDPGPQRSALIMFGASGADPGVRLRPLVDGAERRLAARRRAPHSVQHDVGAAARSGGRGHLRRRRAWSSSTPSPVSRVFS